MSAVTSTSGIYKFSLRQVLALVIASAVSSLGFLWPFIASTNGVIARNHWFFWAIVPVTLLVLIAQLTSKGFDAKSIALLAVLAAVMAALRPMGAGAAGIEPMWFVLICAAFVFGPSFGFILGVVALVTSAFFTAGFGPWLAYQAFAAGWIGAIAGIFRSKKYPRLVMIAVGIFSAELFGLLMDLQFWPFMFGTGSQLSYAPELDFQTNIHRFFVYHFSTSMAWDIPRAITTTVLLMIAGPALITALERAKFKAAFVTPIEFIERVKEQKAK